MFKTQGTQHGDSPDGPVAKTPGSQCRGSGFNLWSGNWIPLAAVKTLVQPNKKIKRNTKKNTQAHIPAVIREMTSSQVPSLLENSIIYLCDKESEKSK